LRDTSELLRRGSMKIRTKVRAGRFAQIIPTVVELPTLK
jgi:hypothetical protein